MAFLWIMDEDIGRKDLFVFKLTEGTRLVHHRINIGFILYGKGFSNPMLDLWISCFQNDMLPVFTDREERTPLDSHDIHQLRNDQVENFSHLDAFPLPQFQKDLLHNLI